MRLLRNLLALVGLLALLAIGGLILVLEPYVYKAHSLDEAALAVYSGAARTILATGDPTAALVYQRRVADGLAVADVEIALGRVAEAADLHTLGALSVDRQVRNQAGVEFPFLKIYLFCDPQLAADLIRHTTAMAAFLPCRIILHEDERGGLWLMTPNLDLVIHGGRPLPIALQERALGLQSTLREIVDRAAAGQA
ncbi:protein of unknown function DUF302 [Thioalkalivibrio nitratireducens DSM 14787]|uniref:DUF302 domain-containing protein n=1 Tax=Thioalkalivibrio nitratireducens (strain DSM 14787 / UNIQEM 213 / ALEN2) TaxID=1255043 RepID=L0DYA1_THIND|nr:DUF302 domain-containing protein [Thioalkalivibrio nitratireducens]AGA34579.1 protein of unknown function DUF302 [Thioalkalivibrio nitratireducens DSM 14787]